MSYEKKITKDLLRLAGLAIKEGGEEAQIFIHQLAKKYGREIPKASEALLSLLSKAPIKASPLRRQSLKSIPVDNDSRLELAKLEFVSSLPVEPIFDKATEESLKQLINERKQIKKLKAEGLAPTRTVLFVGPPGVGKSLSARYLAMELKKPLVILNLSAVMSSLLGRTGSNLKQVLDYAKSEDCILFLDEIDAIAKKRNDHADIGELKRLVTVLLQEVDCWPVSSSLLVAASNHPELLDPAMWRRFEMQINFPIPLQDAVESAIKLFFGDQKQDCGIWVKVLAKVFANHSFSDIERKIMEVRRLSVLTNMSVSEQFEKMVCRSSGLLDYQERVSLSKEMLSIGTLSQRKINAMTGVNRGKLRQIQKNKKNPLAEKEVSCG